MSNSTASQSSASLQRSHSGTKRSYPVDDGDDDDTEAVRPYKYSLPRIDRPTQTSPVDSSSASEHHSGTKDSSGIFPSFRSVSACNRCRIRKNRCDQRLPRCSLCKKAGVHCVGYDPTLKREVPRSYVFFLESRVLYLEKLLADNGIEFAPPEPYEGEARATETDSPSAKVPPSGNGATKKSPVLTNRQSAGRVTDGAKARIKDERQEGCQKDLAHQDVSRDDSPEQSTEQKPPIADSTKGLDSLVSKIGMVPVHGASDSRYLGSTSGISFARVVFAAVRSSVSSGMSERGNIRPSPRRASTAPGTSGSSMRDSFFGLQVKPSMNRAPFPDISVAQRLVDLYFEYANPQAPILHRGEFTKLFKRVYATEEKDRSPRDLYILYIVCAIGAGIIFDVKRDAASPEGEKQSGDESSASVRAKKRKPSPSHQYQPEEYHASAVLHLESCLSSSSATDGFGGGLDELQAVLLLASFALLRPVAPGLWYIVGVAVRLAIDLGLHHEDGTGLDSVDGNASIGQANRPEYQKSAQAKSNQASSEKLGVHARERGRREWIRDLRRRLWWSVYSFDRLVSTCVGRPFGITDQVITTEFPSLLDDKYITKSGFETPPSGKTASYKHVAHHYFKLRLLQSEIQQVLQYQQANIARKSSPDRGSAFIPMDLPSPFLQRFDSFRLWRRDVHRRLDNWFHSAPTSQTIGVEFSVGFFELNYWQALTMLYRQSLTVPAPLAADVSQIEHAMSPSLASAEDDEDQDEIYVKVAEAGQKTLRLYRQLHHVRLVNYTYLATHHLFMAGISFLYAIWHSPVVRSQLTFDDVDFTVLGAIAVLEDLMEKCPPAEACRDAFERMSKATVKMCLSTNGFGSSAHLSSSKPLNVSGRPRNAGFDQFGNQVSNIRDRDRAPPTLSAPVSSELSTTPSHTNSNHPPALQHGRPVEYSRGYGSLNLPKQLSPVQSHAIAHTSPFTNIQQHVYTTSAPSQGPQYPYSSEPPVTQPPYSAPPDVTLPNLSDQDFRYLPEFDFLNLAPQQLNPELSCNATGATNIGGTNAPEMGMFSMSSPFGNNGDPSDETGVNLGYGFSVDLQHDWSETANYDLFGEFFFGNGTGGT